ncbi:MAG: hypothetical protein KME23_16445 [Goleter apudmare HA4340-LM2]|nr:hypothetical protein [Goleter apudmare HA4340-LM2]
MGAALGCGEKLPFFPANFGRFPGAFGVTGSVVASGVMGNGDKQRWVELIHCYIKIVQASYLLPNDQ